MRETSWRALLLVLLALATGAAWGQTEGKRQCALGYRNSIFTPTLWPDRPLEELVRGQLGVIDPRFDHLYLFLAYRRVAGKPVTAQDVERLRRFDPCWQDGSNGHFGKDWDSSSVMVAARLEWASARALLGPPAAARKAGARSVMGYGESAVPNCNPDAFRTAARSLRARVAAHGPNAWVREWAEGQDKVMQLCFDASGELPRAAPGAPAWLLADRQYQMAAAHLYAGHYDEAARRFADIGADTASPWQPLGHYLAARARLRQASATQQEAEATELLQQARQLLETAAVGASDAAMRADIARMLQRVRLKTEPDPMFAELDARLGAPSLPDGVGQDVRDFDPQRAGDVPLDARESFAAWLKALRGGVVPADADIASASRLALVAWLTAAQPNDPRAAELLQRAASIPRTSPEFLTVQLQRIRLLPDRLQALRLARELLALPPQALNMQDRNRIKALALPMAQTATELALLAYREPIAHEEVQALRQPGVIVPAVDEDGAVILNRGLPLDRLYVMYASALTPAPLRQELLGVVWTRALVLGRWDLLHKLHPDMRHALPGASALLRKLEAAQDAQERRARAALFLLLHPGIVGSVGKEIAYAQETTELALPNMHRRLLQDGSRENWWCSLPAGRYWHQDPAPAPPPLPAFLTTQDKRQWRREYDILIATPNGTEYLAPIALEWAKAHPRDTQLPAALRMIVRSARGGVCHGVGQADGARRLSSPAPILSEERSGEADPELGLSMAQGLNRPARVEER